MGHQSINCAYSKTRSQSKAAPGSSAAPRGETGGGDGVSSWLMDALADAA